MGADSDPRQGTLPGRGSSELSLDHRKIQEDSHEVEGLYITNRLKGHWGGYTRPVIWGLHVAGM